jgi:hypothetical protein
MDLPECSRRTPLKSVDRSLDRASAIVFAFLAICLFANVVGIPRTIVLKLGDIALERPPHVYMLKDSQSGLRGLPLFELLADIHLADIRETDLRMSEDGVPLGKPFASYEDMINVGKGSYLGRYDRLSFTTSDNSDPRGNGRTYVVSFRVGFQWAFLGILVGIVVILRGILVLQGWPANSARNAQTTGA